MSDKLFPAIDKDPLRNISDVNDLETEIINGRIKNRISRYEVHSKLIYDLQSLDSTSELTFTADVDDDIDFGDIYDDISRNEFEFVHNQAIAFGQELDHINNIWKFYIISLKDTQLDQLKRKFQEINYISIC